MVLETIYITRHGSRANWFGVEAKAHHSGRIPPDTPLSTHGETQAEDLATRVLQLDASVDIIYSSPFYRCVQTVQPIVDQARKQQGRIIEIRGDLGLGEWYGLDRINDPQPASPDVLQDFFPTYALHYESKTRPELTGESIEDLHQRAARTMAGIIQELDADPSSPRAILICTHAATFMALARSLTGLFPKDITAGDFEPWTASLSTFKRRKFEGITTPISTTELDWKDGKGIGGGWDCEVNGDTTFLRDGEDRGWRFSGKESFSHNLTAHGLDAGTGLGIISYGREKKDNAIESPDHVGATAAPH